MFTRLVESARPRTWPLGGAAWSVAAHALVVAALVVRFTAQVVQLGATTTRLPPESERLHWIGTAGRAPDPARATRTRGHAPIAYAMEPRGGARRRLAPTLPRFTIPDVPIIDVSMIVVPGLAASSPDFRRLLEHLSDWLGPPRPDTTSRLARAAVRPSGAATAEDDAGLMPIPLVTNPAPTYPPTLLRAGVGGTVVVQFVIDSTGAVDLRSVRIVSSSDRAFTRAVRDVLPRLRFVPAFVPHRPVAIRVEQPFDFHPPGDGEGPTFVP